MATHHPLYFLYCEAQLGRRNGTECVPEFVCVSVCLCAAISCLLLDGDSPSSLAVIQDLFSPSLYITTNGNTDALCPVLSFPPPPPALPFFHCHFLFCPSLPLCVEDVTVLYSLVLLYHPWDCEVARTEHKFWSHTQCTWWYTRFQGVPWGDAWDVRLLLNKMALRIQDPQQHMPTGQHPTGHWGVTG